MSSKAESRAGGARSAGDGAGGHLPPTTSTAANYFGAMVESYDSLIRRAIPRYDEMTLRLIEHIRPGAKRILELGCGTGNLTLELLRRLPDAGVTAVDAAPEMTGVVMDRARERGAGVSGRLKTVTARFEAFDATAGTFDLVTSSMSLHHVKDKAPLYRAIARWLRPGGQLVFADQLAGATEFVHQKHWELWERFCREPGHCTEEEIRSLTEHSRAHDHYVPFAEHLRMMTGAGFTGVDLVWRIGMYSVVVADRP